jgi:hypothetical protein
MDGTSREVTDMSRFQSKARIKQLLDEHPPLRQVYNEERAGYNYGRTRTEVNFRITVQRGDARLLFSAGSNVDGDRSYIGSPDAPGLKGDRFEYFYPVNHQGQIGEIRNWIESKATGRRYVRDTFEWPMYDWKAQDSHFGDNAFDVIDSLIWVTREKWYDEGADLSHPIIKPVPGRVDVYITLFRSPKQGWRQLYLDSDPLRNVPLTGSKLFMGADILTDPYVTVIYDRFNRLAGKFQDLVWDGGLGERIISASYSGMIGQYGTVQLRSYILAGRLALTFSRGDAEVQLGGFDQIKPNLGLNAIDGTAQQAQEMIEEVMRFWKETDDETCRNILKPVVHD